MSSSDGLARTTTWYRCPVLVSSGVFQFGTGVLTDPDQNGVGVLLLVSINMEINQVYLTHIGFDGYKVGGDNLENVFVNGKDEC